MHTTINTSFGVHVFLVDVYASSRACRERHERTYIHAVSALPPAVRGPRPRVFGVLAGLTTVCRGRFSIPSNVSPAVSERRR